MRTQFRAMMWYEFQMHWRRRALIVITLSLVVLNLLMVYVSRDALMEGTWTLSAGSVLPDIVPFLWIVVYIVILIFIGPMTADSISIDRQHGMSELLSSLPLPRSIYLVGKIAGMFSSIGACFLLSMVIIGLGTWGILGPFDLPAFFQMWLLGVLPIAFLNPAISLLLAAGQPTRRRAAAIGGVFALVCLMAFSSGAAAAVRNTQLTLLDHLSPARVPLLRFFMPGGSQMISTTDIVVTILLGLVQVAVLFVLMWGYLLLQDRRN